MSADLFAEFEPFSKPAQQTQQPAANKPSQGQPQQPVASNQFLFGATAPTPAPAPLGSPANPAQPPGQWFNYQQPPAATTTSTGWGASWAGPNPAQNTFSQTNNDNDDDDAWGDFEVAAPAAAAPPPAFPQPQAAAPTVAAAAPFFSQNPAPPPPQRTRILRASTMDLLSNNLVDLPGSFTPPVETKTTTPSWGPANAAGQRGGWAAAAAPKPAVQTKPRAATTGADVLFDADDFDGQPPEDEDEDDDFGDFETVQNPPDLLSQPQPRHSQPAGSTSGVSSASQMLSGLNLTEPTSPYPQAPKSPSFQTRNPFPGLALNTPPEGAGKKQKEPEKEKAKATGTPITAWPELNSAGSNVLDEGWGTFEDRPAAAQKRPPAASKPAESSWDWDSVEPVKPTKPAPKKSAPKKASPTKPAVSSTLDSSWDWDPVDADTNTNTKAGAEPKTTIASTTIIGDDSVDDNNRLPPTNIPPPSILLSIFPQLFSEASQKLFQPVSGQASFSIKKRILSDPRTVGFLRGYLALAAVGARILAGRRARWHRDKFLSQRMSISAAGSKGMKLAAVDKAETAREDREAADVVALWTEQVGRLRSAVAAANSSLPPDTSTGAGHLKIPELRETAQIQTAKAVPTAPKACLVCGLKRDERLPKVDHDVEDSFGEWWADHWGHTTCKRFWLQHETVLRQR